MQKGATALYLASEKGHVEVVRALVQRPDIQVDLPRQVTHASHNQPRDRRVSHFVRKKLTMENVTNSVFSNTFFVYMLALVG